ncbi:MAG TPA: GNAT family N-acetyltransferase [Terriglobales bacterium]
MTAVPANLLANDVVAREFTVSALQGGIEIVERIADEWRDLCTRAVNDQPFYRPEWIRAYLQAFAPTARVVLVTVRRDGILQLLLPLLKERAWVGGVALRRLRSPVNSHPGRFDAVLGEESDRTAVLGAALDYLARLPGWDLLEMHFAPANSTIAEFVSTARSRNFRCVEVPLFASPFIAVPRNSDGLKRMPPNSKLRSQLKQARRQLEQKSPLTLRRLNHLDREALRRFYELEASGWKGQQGSAILSHASTRQFYDEVAEAAARSNSFCLYLLEWNGQLLAGHFGLVHKGRYYSPKVAYDENLKKYAPGHLILAEILNDCASRGMEEIDITGPCDDWKMKWTADSRANYSYFLFAKSIRARVAHAIRFKLRPALAALIRKQRRAA